MSVVLFRSFFNRKDENEKFKTLRFLEKIVLFSLSRRILLIVDFVHPLRNSYSTTLETESNVICK